MVRLLIFLITRFLIRSLEGTPRQAVAQLQAIEWPPGELFLPTASSGSGRGQIGELLSKRKQNIGIEGTRTIDGLICIFCVFPWTFYFRATAPPLPLRPVMSADAAHHKLLLQTCHINRTLKIVVESISGDLSELRKYVCLHHNQACASWLTLACCRLAQPQGSTISSLSAFGEVMLLIIERTFHLACIPWSLFISYSLRRAHCV